MEEQSLFSEKEMGFITLEEVFEAYFACCKHKRGTYNAMRFELDYEEGCYDLWQDINNGTYRIGRSIVFVVDKPVKREIFAADFRDRVVHHLIAKKILPLLEGEFIEDSYATRPGKGTLYGIRRIEQMIRECSDNYTRDCYIMKLDVQSFFMNIRKQTLYDLISDFLLQRYKGNDINMLLWLLRLVIFNNPVERCIVRSPREKWTGMPKNKSLFGTDGTHGLPIGNLTSQLLALLYLNSIDHKITEEWGVAHYGRYVDDMVLVVRDRQKLLAAKRILGCRLGTLGLRLHPRKVYLQHYAKGVQFVGGMVLPGRKYVSRRVTGNIFHAIYRFNEMAATDDSSVTTHTEEMMRTMNSYFGMLKHFNSYRLTHKIIGRIDQRWFRSMYIQRTKGNYRVVKKN